MKRINLLSVFNIKKFCLLILFAVVGCGGQSNKESTETPPVPDTTSNISDGTLKTNYRMFATSTGYDGDLGGLSGADSKCQARATAAGLTRAYKAILSSSTVDAIDRLNLSLTGKVVMITSTGAEVAIASSITSLFQATTTPLLHTPNYDENGNNVTGFSTYTGSYADGKKIDTDHDSFCADWTQLSGGSYVGSPESTDGQWLEIADSNCSNGADKRLYCISQ